MAFSHSETPEHVQATLGAILRRHREAQERSLSDIAGPAGISGGFLSEVERGRKDVSTERLLKVARALDVTVAQLLFLQSEDPEKEIGMYINSPGGSLSASLSIYDTMQYVRPEVLTLCTGFAASGGSLLLAGGAAGKRYSLPHSQILVHQPWTGGMQGQATDIEIHAREILRQREELVNIYSRHCGRPKEQVERDIERDFFMTPEEARSWGLIDGVIEHAAA